MERMIEILDVLYNFHRLLQFSNALHLKGCLNEYMVFNIVSGKRHVMDFMILDLRPSALSNIELMHLYLTIGFKLAESKNNPPKSYLG